MQPNHRAAIGPETLRVIQERDFTPVGSTGKVKVDARIVAATNANLKNG